MKQIYFDNAATTAVEPEVVETMLPYFTEAFGNASSPHGYGRSARKEMEKARDQVASLIGAQPEEIIFTSGGTESDNLALFGVLEAQEKKGKHIITSLVEHHAVLHTCEYLEKIGKAEVTYLPVDENGLVDPQAVEKAIRPDTVLISIMLANNEIGTIQPIAEIGKIAKKHQVTLHTDAVQAVGAISVDVNELNVDLLTLTAHKIYGPKGIGALFVRKGTRIKPLIHGGSHERNLRAGTESVVQIIGLGKAAEIAQRELKENGERITKLRDYIVSEVLEKIPYSRLNGDGIRRLPNNVNMSFSFLEGEALLLMLDMKGIACSSGSACTSGSLDPSHVLLAIGLDHETAHGSLRITLGRHSTKEEADYLIQELPPIVARLRMMSPLWPPKE
ncbi:MAG: cysteine desulfurase NifS [Negativicutes bacterium]|nr:cysteine desulfurase NifS [Negativicutes bacterium]